MVLRADRRTVVGRPLAAPEPSAAVHATVGEPSPAYYGDEDGKAHEDDKGSEDDPVAPVQGKREPAASRTVSSRQKKEVSRVGGRDDVQEAIHNAKQQDQPPEPEMNPAIQGRHLCLPVLPMVEETKQKLAQDKEGDEEAQDLMVGIEASRLRSGSD